jgi:pimeloyl-ACP methyl ester carboxylesterase
MPPFVATARLRGGIVLPFVEHGPADGIPVLFLHGAGDHWRSFAPVLPHLSPRLRALALTLRGHDGASQPHGGYSIPELAGDVLDFLDAQRLDRVVVSGHSLGSAIALQLALAAPERVAGLVLASGFAYLSGHAIDEFTAAVHSLSDPIDPRFVAMLQSDALGSHLPPRLFEAMVEHSRRMPARVWRAVIDAVRDFDVARLLPYVKAPVLLVWGTRDVFLTASTQEILLNGLPHAELMIFHDGGHTPHWYDPPRYGHAVGEFAARVFAARPPMGG